MDKPSVSPAIRMVWLRKYIFFILTIVWMIIIFMFSNSSGDESGEISRGVGGLFCKIFVPGYEEMVVVEQEELALLLDYPIRKFAHFMEYMILGVLMIGIPQFTVKSDYWKRGLIVWGFACLYAISDEVHQLFVPGRCGALKDVLLDSVGASVGVFLGLLMVRWVTVLKSKIANKG